MSYVIETKTAVAAPAEFARAFLLDISNRRKISRTPDGREPEVWWEGSPWQRGSTLVTRTPTTMGQSVTVRAEIVTAEPGELFRIVTRKMGIRFTVGCSVTELGLEKSTISQVMLLEGWASLFAKMIPREGLRQFQEDTVRSEIELAWLRAKESDRRPAE